jgi:glutaredoxin-related protein
MANESLTRRKQKEWTESPGSWCPCGKAQIPYKDRHHLKYCSPACRKQYGKPSKVKDPAKYRTFVCENCNKQVTRLKRLGAKFCSNECAAKFTKTKHHLAFRDDDVLLDSAWEGLLWCLCRFLKVPIERVDRAKAVEWAPGRWYAPDFLMGHTYIEVKGLEDPEDWDKWHAWNNKVGRLLVVDLKMMNKFRKMNRDELMGYALTPYETIQETASAP